jgi:dTDP-4-amino-4,6-dideoxy-D-galactose acyltransferase
MSCVRKSKKQWLRQPLSDLYQLLEWDTAFFGFRVARVRVHHLTPDSIKAIETWCAEQNITCLYFLAEMDDPLTTYLAETHDFRLVDVRVTFDMRGDAIQNKPIGLMVRLYQDSDLPTLIEIARVSYSDSRYYFDPCFSRAQCDVMYETWIKRSCEGFADAVFVCEIDRQPVGFITCHLKDGVGQIGLVGVAETARGKSVGRSLVIQALQWFQINEADSVTVVTQGRNIAAQRLYQRCGFNTREMQLWYHRWFRKCEHG